jgi:hypothetical protein
VKPGHARMCLVSLIVLFNDLAMAARYRLNRENIMHFLLKVAIFSGN